jgi:hypothetical protein
MGLFDEVWFEEQVSGIQSPCRRFQTKSLHCCLVHYIITKEGRLHLKSNMLAEDMSSAGMQENSEGKDTEFHGDIRLVADEGPFEEYIARFTHGTLEWVRPITQVPEFYWPPS